MKYIEPVCFDCDYLLSESDKKAKLLKKEYEKQHKACPKCGSEDYTTTLAGYTFNIEHPESYKDLNDCTCHNCGDKHLRHDRVPKWTN